MSTKIIQAYSDDGHGWAKIHMSDLIDLGIQNEISKYSFIKTSDNPTATAVFLEEDGDLTKFVEAFRKKYPGTKLEFKTQRVNGQSSIRNYRRYGVIS